MRRLVSAMLVCLTVSLSMLMPLTEITFSSDRFILSGHDSELSLLAFLLFLGTVLLLADGLARRMSLRPADSGQRLEAPPDTSGPAELAESAAAAMTALLPALVPLRI